MEPQKPENRAGSQDAEEPDRPLGRGLEQISHLFLTQRITSPEPALPNPQARSRAGPTMLLQPNTSIIPKDHLVAVLRDSQGALEEGLRVIDIFVQCHPHSDIDLLATNRADQLTIIDLETDLNDALVLRGLAHRDWLEHNLLNIRRMYPGQTFNMPPAARLFLIAPSFSRLALNAARQLTQLQIYWIRYHAFETGSATGIFFEPMVCE